MLPVLFLWSLIHNDNIIFSFNLTCLVLRCPCTFEHVLYCNQNIFEYYQLSSWRFHADFYYCKILAAGGVKSISFPYAVLFLKLNTYTIQRTPISQSFLGIFHQSEIRNFLMFFYSRTNNYNVSHFIFLIFLCGTLQFLIPFVSKSVVPLRYHIAANAT